MRPRPLPLSGRVRAAGAGLLIWHWRGVICDSGDGRAALAARDDGRVRTVTQA